jgi:hypothetical protein
MKTLIYKSYKNLFILLLLFLIKVKIIKFNLIKK